jgi:hypothetical protein
VTASLSREDALLTPSVFKLQLEAKGYGTKFDKTRAYAEIEDFLADILKADAALISRNATTMPAK